jgi:protease I
MTDITDKKVAILVDYFFEDADFSEPLQALKDEGIAIEVIVAEPENGKVQFMKNQSKSNTYWYDKTLEEADIDDYDGLVLPGGAINVDSLRMQEKAREWVRSIAEKKKLLAA